MPCAEAKELLEWASQAVAREQQQLPEDFDIDHGSKGYVKARHRDNSLSNLLKLSNHFGFEPETFANAVILTDRFLGRVKVYPKYMQCVSMAGLLLSAKITEEEEFVPTVSDFITVGRCDCSIADLKRMEKLMVTKLNWDLLSVTPVVFLHKFLRLFVTSGLVRANTVLATARRLTPSLLSMLCKKSIFQHRGSLLVLCLLWNEMEHSNVDCTSKIVDFARYLGISDHEFMHCVGVVNDFMELLLSNTTTSRKRKRSAMFSAKVLPTIDEASTAAESEDDELDVDDVADMSSVEDLPNATATLSLEELDKAEHQAIKPLYSTVVKSSCGSLVCQDLTAMFNDQPLVF